MEGRVVMVTGASSGIGVETALALARRGATVVMACREPERGAAAAESVRTASGSKQVELLHLELASFASIRAAAATFKARHQRLHVLIHNAGVWAQSRRLSEDGFELTFAVNHLAQFLLTQLLLDPLSKSGARVISVSSALHAQGLLLWDDLMLERRPFGRIAYCQSKLANVLFVRELARRAIRLGITANTLHPGLIATDLGREASPLLRGLIRLLSKSPEKGARTSVYLASSEEVARTTGKYFVDCRERAPSKAAQDDAAAARLWHVSETLCGISSLP